MKKRVAILGATGSIGAAACDVLRINKDAFEPALFSAARDAEGLAALAREFPAASLALENEGAADLGAGRVWRGTGAASRALEALRPDIVLNGISGSAGLAASFTAASLGCTLALANKESIVMAWDLIKAAADASGGVIVPVDSECSAVFTLTRRHGKEALSGVVLTASGGPFRSLSARQLETVTPEEALRHPTWKMGAKISLDSATLANKGLELMQISRVIGIAPGLIQVSVHPQSIVHSMITTTDGAVYAALSLPDMRLPIHQALHFPRTVPSPWGAMCFDMAKAAPLSLSFDPPDMETFPMLRLAYEAARAQGRYPLCYNAANEAAGARFLAGEIPFTGISRIVEAALQKDWSGSACALEGLLEADNAARVFAREVQI